MAGEVQWLEQEGVGHHTFVVVEQSGRENRECGQLKKLQCTPLVTYLQACPQLGPKYSNTSAISPSKPNTCAQDVVFRSGVFLQVANR